MISTIWSEISKLHSGSFPFTCCVANNRLRFTDKKKKEGYMWSKCGLGPMTSVLDTTAAAVGNSKTTLERNSNIHLSVWRRVFVGVIFIIRKKKKLPWSIPESDKRATMSMQQSLNGYAGRCSTLTVTDCGSQILHTMVVVL